MKQDRFSEAQIIWILREAEQSKQEIRAFALNTALPNRLSMLEFW
jgi:hypothetical protein